MRIIGYVFRKEINRRVFSRLAMVAVGIVLCNLVL